jgi:hypothetical protein
LDAFSKANLGRNILSIFKDEICKYSKVLPMWHLTFWHLRKTVPRLEVLLIISSGTRSDSMTLS